MARRRGGPGQTGRVHRSALQVDESNARKFELFDGCQTGMESSLGKDVLTMLVMDHDHLVEEEIEVRLWHLPYDR